MTGISPNWGVCKLVRVSRCKGFLYDPLHPSRCKGFLCVVRVSCMSPHSRQFCVWASAPPRRRCAGARALDSPLPPRQLYSDHPTPLPPKMQPMSRARREATCTRSTNGCGSLSGANRVWGGLSVAETEERRIAVAKDGAKRAVVTRARRSRKHWRIPPPRTDMGGQ